MNWVQENHSSVVSSDSETEVQALCQVLMIHWSIELDIYLYVQCDPELLEVVLSVF